MSIKGITTRFHADPSDSFSVALQLAIESVTATHQLEAAVMTLSKCVRPLLLTGSLVPLHKDIGIEQVCQPVLLKPSRNRLCCANCECSAVQTQSSGEPVQVGT